MEVTAIVQKCRKGDGKNGPWCLYTKDGSRLLGSHPSKEAAIKQEQAIQIHKAKGSVLQALQEVAADLQDSPLFPEVIRMISEVQDFHVLRFVRCPGGEWHFGHLPAQQYGSLPKDLTARLDNLMESRDHSKMALQCHDIPWENLPQDNQDRIVHTLAKARIPNPIQIARELYQDNPKALMFDACDIGMIRAVPQDGHYNFAVTTYSDEGYDSKFESSLKSVLASPHDTVRFNYRPRGSVRRLQEASVALSEVMAELLDRQAPVEILAEAGELLHELDEQLDRAGFDSIMKRDEDVAEDVRVHKIPILPPTEQVSQ
jgi:hypothetical protein